VKAKRLGVLEGSYNSSSKRLTAVLGALRTVAATPARRPNARRRPGRRLLVVFADPLEFAALSLAILQVVVWVDAYTLLPVVRGTVLGLILLSVAALFWTRVGHPYATALRPYRVLAVKREHGEAVTIELAADGHDGLQFEPGQFARLRAPRRNSLERAGPRGWVSNLR
jgi:hypothetical protein